MFLRKLSYFVIACAVSVSLFGFIKAADDPIKKAAAQLQKWIDNEPQEKVYLHFDKPYYAIGDDIWFKAYITVGPLHQLSALSGALNVDLIDERDSIVQSIKLPVLNGLTRGDFALPDTLKEGNYRVRAYTNWMRNAGPGYFFDKTIQIGNAVNNRVFTKANFTYSGINGQQTVTTLVNYSDFNGAPYANKEVSYQVQFSAKEVAKGKGFTDEKGNINITFTGAQQATQARIITKIKLEDKLTITKIIPVKGTSAKVDVQFFPESGNLVNGLPSKIAFKATGADGLGKAITGVVVDDNNNEISKITTQHLGMGIFMLVPEAGQNYKAIVTFEDGAKATLPLPKALAQGYVLNLNSLSDAENISVRITASPGMANTEVNLVAQSAGKIYYAAKSTITNGIISTKIPRNRFPSGITQFTLFNAAGDAVNERLIFINNPDLLKLGITDTRGTYAPREEMKLQVTANSPDGKAVLSSLSASVINESKVPVNELNETTILSQLLLSSDITGYVEQPNYYFINNEQQTRSDLDVLMLTQGYRRFEWKQLMADTFAPLNYQPENTLQISGRVHDGNKPVVNGKVTLFTTKGGTFVLDTITDANGRFVFKNLIFKDSIKFVIQARTAKNKRNVEIDLDRLSPQKVTPNVNAPDIDVNINSTMMPYLQSSKTMFDQQVKLGVGNHNILLKEVTIREKKKPLVENSSNLNGAGSADQIIKGDLFETLGCPDITVCLQGRLLGVVFRGGIPYSTRSYNQPMQVIVDGVYVDPSYLSSINAFDIGSIEVLRSIGYTAIYGSRGGAGVIIVNTKRGNEAGGVQRYSPGIITYAPKGYYQARTFYSPRYGDPGTNAALADLRSTVYWNADLITDKDGKAVLGYENADKGNYRIVIEGIDAEGHIGRYVYRYKVQ